MRRKRRGAALIMALLVVALAGVLGASLLWRLDIRIGQIEGGRQHAQARALARAGVDYARAVLADDARRSSVDHGGESWATSVAPLEVEDGEIGGHIEDARSKWNLNNVVASDRADAGALAIYRRLLDLLGLPETLADALADWLDADEETSGAGGAESGYYLGLPQPRVAANRPLTDLEGLAEIRGYNNGVISRLRPYVTVLPGTQPINVNTASPEVLAAVVPGLELADAHRVARERATVWFRDVSDFRNRFATDMTAATAARLAVGSEYFLVDVAARQGSARTHLRALLHRHGQDTPAIVWMAPR